MAYLRTASTLSAVVAAVVAIPDVARACSPDPCWFELPWIDSIAPVNAAGVPSDGVLVLSATAGSQLPVGDIAASLALEVSLAGEPVPGNIEDPGVRGVIVWRPDAPLQSGAAYDVVGTFNNPADVHENGCGEASIPIEFEFDAVDPAEPLAAPIAVASGAALFIESNSLADLVCCDDAFPYEFSCGGLGPEWDAGACAATRGTGHLQLDVSVESPLAQPTAAMLVTVIRVDDVELYRGLAPAFSQRRDGPVCIVVEHHDLASGESVAAAEQCVGQDLVDEFGEKSIDAAAELAGQCQGPLYVCELNEFQDGWDPDKCSDFVPPAESESDSESESDGESESESDGDTESESDGQPTTDNADGSGSSAGESGDTDPPIDDDVKDGCGCNSRANDPAALLGLVVLAGLVRRRRR